MLNDKEKLGWDVIDEIAVISGGYLAKPKRPLVIEYDYRAMTEYCREKGISKMDLTEAELGLFLYTEPLVYV